jgi:hypothetical protein
MRTYVANVHDPPALALVILPGFGSKATAHDMKHNFIHFAQSQFGQRKCFTTYFQEMPVFCARGFHDAVEYTEHAERLGQHDVYINVTEGERVNILELEGPWALLALVDARIAGWTPTGWAPAYCLPMS